MQCLVYAQILTYNGFYDDQLEWVGLEGIQLVASMNPGSTLGRHQLSTRFTSTVRIAYIRLAQFHFPFHLPFLCVLSSFPLLGISLVLTYPLISPLLYQLPQSGGVADHLQLLLASCSWPRPSFPSCLGIDISYSSPGRFSSGTLRKGICIQY